MRRRAGVLAAASVALLRTPKYVVIRGTAVKRLVVKTEKRGPAARVRPARRGLPRGVAVRCQWRGPRPGGRGEAPRGGTGGPAGAAPRPPPARLCPAIPPRPPRAAR